LVKEIVNEKRKTAENLKWPVHHNYYPADVQKQYKN